MGERKSLVLLASVFLVASCALVYELIAGTVSSYLLGSSVTQFSLVIGIFLSAMGLGSFLTKYIQRDLLSRFVQVEILIGVVGGFSSALLFAAFTYTETYTAVMVAVTGAVGTLIGLEIPLIIRILREQQESLRLTVANVMTVDYIGALAASLAFPFLLVPHLGLMRAAFATGLLNLAVAWLGIVSFPEACGPPRRLRAWAGIATIVLLLGVAASEELVTFFEDRIYPDEIIYARQTPYQRIVITRWRDDTRLFLNKNLQFSSKDEYRYHEALVHPAMYLAPRRERVLILGGGDGMVARECLKYADVRQIDLVDIDPEMTRLFQENPLLVGLNSRSLQNPRVHVINEDAMEYLKRTEQMYDVMIMDLPDPSVLALGKLYTRAFYVLASRRLDPHGIMTVQSSSPYFAANAFWCIANTLADVPVVHGGEPQHLQVRPYHVNVPSFGIWGFVLASPEPLRLEGMRLRVPTRFLTEGMLPKLFEFPADMQPRRTEVNRLDNQVLVQYYTKGYGEFYGE